MNSRRAFLRRAVSGIAMVAVSRIASAKTIPSHPTYTCAWVADGCNVDRVYLDGVDVTNIAFEADTANGFVGVYPNIGKPASNWMTDAQAKELVRTERRYGNVIVRWKK